MSISRLKVLPLSLLSFPLVFSALAFRPASAQVSLAAPVTLSSGWQLQDVAKVPDPGDKVSSASFNPKNWYAATVPGTVLTTLVNNKVYPEPLYGENNRPENIPESLCHTSYWYRNVIQIPAGYSGRRIWLNFDGINFSSEIWVNGVKVGETKGAFHPRQLRHHRPRQARQASRHRRARLASAPSRRPP